MEQVLDIVRSKDLERTTEIVLENLNISSLDPLMEDLCKFKNLKTLKLASNSLSSLPQDMSGLKKLEYLDISGNNFKELKDIMSGLFSLPKLRHLFIDLSEPDEEEIVMSLELESFNGTHLDFPDDSMDDTYAISQMPSTKESQTNQTSTKIKIPTVTVTSDDKKKPLVTLTKHDIEAAQKVYDAVCSFSQNQNALDFNAVINQAKSQLTALIQGEIDELKCKPELLNSKRLLFDHCFDELITRAANTHKDLPKALSAVYNAYTALLDEYYNVTHNIIQTYTQQIQALKTQIEQKNKQAEELLEAAEMLEKQAAEHEAAKKKLAKQFETEKEKLVEEVGWANAELEKCKSRLRQMQLNRQHLASQVNTSPKDLLKSQKSLEMSKSNSITPGTSSSKKGHSPLRTNRQLTLKQLRDVIEEIYASKTKFDQKCYENHLPRETMEQHLYTYLNQKYGLKTLIIDWASAIIQAVKKYSAEDNDVAVFGKILRNEIDEEFRFVQKQLKETVEELLRVYLRGKYPLKVDSEINLMLQKRMCGYIYESEWVDIIKYMYNKEDSVNVIVKVKEAIRQSQQPKRGKTPVRERDLSSRDQNKILYVDFVRVLLDFQLKGHERFLHKFVKLFRQFDTDRNGILNELEFRKLILATDPNKTEEEIDSLLNSIDPYNNQQITFSECVTYLSNELVRMMTQSKQKDLQ